MKKKPYFLFAALAAVAALSGCGEKEAVAAAEPIEIEIWTYYNGDQLAAFDALVAEFNETLGKEKGIVVSSYSQGSVIDMETNILEAVQGKVGAEEVPDIFASYAEAAYTVDQLGMAVNLADYLTPEELALYVDDYLGEGDFSDSGEVKIMPVAKSTEVLVINKTDWDKFASAAGVDYSGLATIEALVDTAQTYYEWTDAQTPDVANDGKALFGRDSMANYHLLGAMQLGMEIFQVENGKLSLQFEEGVVRKLWDGYYVPFVKGYFGAGGNFRSDDILTGNLICYVGSSAGVFYFPEAVSISDTESYHIDMDVLPAPQFADSEPYAVQQGAGLVVTKGSEAEIKASVEFLKWFTSDERNIRFSVASGYMPVTERSNDREMILGSAEDINSKVEQTLTASIETVAENTLYTPKPFNRGSEARDILDYSMRDLAAADRQTVLERLEAGQSLEEATADFCSDEYFRAWYESTLSQLQEYDDNK